MEWKVKKLGEIGKVCMCKRIMKHQTSPTGEIPFYKIGTFGRVPDAYIPKEIYEDYKTKYSFPKKGDILISASGTIGRRVIYNGEPAYFQDSNIVWIDNNEKEVLNDYLYKFYGFCDWNPSKGATISRLYNDDLRKISLSYPVSLYEQQQIVEKLDTAFDLIDRAKANIEKNIQDAKELFQSKLNQVFSEKGEGWEEKRIKDLGKVQTGTTPPTKDLDNYGDHIPFVKPAHFNKNGQIISTDSFLSEKGVSKSRLIDANSILMVCIGATIGKTGFTEIDVTCNQQINTLTPNEHYNFKFLYFGMISRIFQESVLREGKGAQATLPIINKSKWESLSLNVNKDLKVQEEIVLMFEKLSAQTELLHRKYQQKLANLEELKKSILEKAFKGELL